LAPTIFHGVHALQMERSRKDDIVAEINGKLRNVIGVRARDQPNSLGIRGAGRGASFGITGSSYEQLAGRSLSRRWWTACAKIPTWGRSSLNMSARSRSTVTDRPLAADHRRRYHRLGRALQALLDVVAPWDPVFIEDKAFGMRMLSTSGQINDPAITMYSCSRAPAR
jgi:HAE1 family hydrophobic/amphiphilic exporter-1